MLPPVEVIEGMIPHGMPLPYNAPEYIRMLPDVIADTEEGSFR
jgi:hypothetical protein